MNIYIYIYKYTYVSNLKKRVSKAGFGTPIIFETFPFKKASARGCWP